MPNPLPPDFGQLKDWLIMPATLTLLANIVINWFFAHEDPQRQNIAKFVVFIATALVSYGLGKLSPDLVQQLNGLWVILAAVITAFYATQAVRQVWDALRLLGLRITLGQATFEQVYTAERLEKHAKS